MKPRALTLLALLFATIATSPAQSPLIGVFESASSGKADNLGQPGVRVLFYQSGQQWHSYNADCKDEACLKTITHLYPLTTRWTLIRSGKPVAIVTAETPTAFHFYSEIGVQAITNPAAVAHLEPHPTPDQPHTILATTRPSLADPDNWQGANIVPVEITRVRQSFQHAFPHPANCDANGKPLTHPWTYADTDITINAGYLSNKNWRLVHLTLTGYHCDGPPDPAFLDHWYALNPTGEIVPLGQLNHLIAIADFSDNGQSELLFSTANGYQLFFDNFSHHATTTIHHH
jgi:hypothetical protein